MTIEFTVPYPVRAYTADAEKRSRSVARMKRMGLLK